MIAVVGGGFAGLTTALALIESGFREVAVFEKTEQLGGLLQTSQGTYGPLESAANGLLLTEPVQKMVDSLGIKVIEKKSRSRYIYSQKPVRWPLGVLASFQLFSGVLKNRYSSPEKGANFESWGSELFGREAMDKLLLPAFSGIYGGQTGQLSASYISDRIRNRKKGRLVSFQGGMGELIGALSAKLLCEGVEIRTSETLAKDSYSDYKKIVFATGLSQLPELLPDEFQSFGKKVLRQKKNSLYTVSGYSKTPIVRGFGCLFPMGTAGCVLGVLQNDQIFPARSRNGWHCETWISEESLSDESLAEIRRDCFPQAGELVFEKRHFWKEVLPLFDENWEGVRKETSWITDRVAFNGNFVLGPGLSDIAEQAYRIAEKWKS